jgi:hypothetical protein
MKKKDFFKKEENTTYHCQARLEEESFYFNEWMTNVCLNLKKEAQKAIRG